MNDNSNNPLSKHFRQPSIYLNLPSKGAYWPDGTVDIPVTGEIPVYPMTTRDEITLRTPDALLNGQGVVDVIKSCVPCIKDPWSMPSVDVDATLIAIRIASYGAEMDVTSGCPHCNASNEHAIDLMQIIARLKMPDYQSPVDCDGLKIRLRPQPYFAINRNNQIMFEEQRILQTVNDDNVSEEVKSAKFNQHMAKLVELNLDGLVGSTDNIEMPDGDRVVDAAFIKDFFNNAPSKIVKQLRVKLDDLAAEAALPKLQVECDECHENYDMGIEFDYASFFDQGS